MSRMLAMKAPMMNRTAPVIPLIMSLPNAFACGLVRVSITLLIVKLSALGKRRTGGLPEGKPPVLLSKVETFLVTHSGAPFVKEYPLVFAEPDISSLTPIAANNRGILFYYILILLHYILVGYLEVDDYLTTVTTHLLDLVRRF